MIGVNGSETGSIRRPLDVLLVAVGTYGDVLPFLVLGRQLRARGHNVTVFASGYYAEHVRRLSLEFVEVGSKEEYVEVLSDPQAFHPLHGLKVLAKPLSRITEGVYGAIQERYVPGRTVTAGSSTAFGARIANEKLGVPMATVNLQTAWFFSKDDPPVLHPRMGWIKGSPRWGRRMSNWLIERLMDRTLGVPIRKFRAELGRTRASALGAFLPLVVLAANRHRAVPRVVCAAAARLAGPIPVL
jgi:rhamnosyltransferase subunit B